MKSKIIVALDVDSLAEATRLVQELRPIVEIFKVGSQLFTQCGPRIIEVIHEQQREVFLDLKFHDIPNTVAKAVGAAARWKVRMLTVHTAGGLEMLRAAAQVPERPALLGVTVLTSQGGDVTAEVLRRARLAQEAGLDGVVASAHEIVPLRNELGTEFLIVTPGIRPAGAAVGDQQRVMTPREAVAAGASFLVIGRPIVAAENPLAAAQQIAAEIGA